MTKDNDLTTIQNEIETTIIHLNKMRKHHKDDLLFKIVTDETRERLIKAYNTINEFKLKKMED